MDAGHALFDTPIGRCGIAWSERGVTALQLPEADEATTRARLAAGSGAAASEPPPSVREAMAAVTALLSGVRADLDGIVLDLDACPPFHRRVYDETRRIPHGQTRSYGEIARALGEPGAARAVGQALGANPVALIVPCHRVLAADGSLHGFSARGGTVTKQRLLAIEGAPAAGTGDLFG